MCKRPAVVVVARAILDEESSVIVCTVTDGSKVKQTRH
jgi:hypothetical protein